MNPELIEAARQFVTDIIQRNVETRVTDDIVPDALAFDGTPSGLTAGEFLVLNRADNSIVAALVCDGNNEMESPYLYLEASKDPAWFTSDARKAFWQAAAWNQWGLLFQPAIALSPYALVDARTMGVDLAYILALWY